MCAVQLRLLCHCGRSSHFQGIFLIALHNLNYQGRSLALSLRSRTPRALVEGLPAGTFAHLNWVLPRVTDTSGYVPASAQEALLENYLGSGPATALTAALEESTQQP